MNVTIPLPIRYLGVSYAAGQQSLEDHIALAMIKLGLAERVAPLTPEWLAAHQDAHGRIGILDPIPLPRNRQIAAFGNLDLAGATVPVGVVMTTEDDANEFGGKVLKFTMAGAVTSKVVIIPIKSDLVAYPSALPNVSFRINYSALITRLYAGLANDAAGANRVYRLTCRSLQLRFVRSLRAPIPGDLHPPGLV